MFRLECVLELLVTGSGWKSPYLSTPNEVVILPYNVNISLIYLQPLMSCPGSRVSESGCFWFGLLLATSLLALQATLHRVLSLSLVDVDGSKSLRMLRLRLELNIAQEDIFALFYCISLTDFSYLCPTVNWFRLSALYAFPFKLNCPEKTGSSNFHYMKFGD